ncbi:hypothetical protein N2F28_06450 [Leuconostoc falkenbergense]
MIPKKIYYAWFGRKKIPDKIKKNIATWKQMNPDYEVIQINETRKDLFNYEDYRFAIKAYQAEKWAYVSDVARLSAIYKQGGIYLDTDVVALKSFDDILDNDEIWAKENSYTINTGLFFAAKQYSPNIENILKRYKSLDFDVTNLAKISTVTIVSQYFWNKGLSTNNTNIQRIENSLIYPTYFFAPVHYWGGGRITKESYTVHQYAASWLTSDKSFRTFIRNGVRRLFNQSVLRHEWISRYVAERKYR